MRDLTAVCVLTAHSNVHLHAGLSHELSVSPSEYTPLNHPWTGTGCYGHWLWNGSGSVYGCQGSLMCHIILLVRVPQFKTIGVPQDTFIVFGQTMLKWQSCVHRAGGDILWFTAVSSDWDKAGRAVALQLSPVVCVEFIKDVTQRRQSLCAFSRAQQLWSSVTAAL